MNAVLRRVLSPIVLGTLGVLALCAVVWWVGPLVAVGEARPLDGVAARAGAIALLLAAWIARIAWAVWRRRRANAALLQGIVSDTAAAIDREGEVLAARFRDAVAKLRAAPGASRGRFGGGDALYELPWYVFVGAPGSGKTTALLNAGLTFVQGDGGDAAIKGVAGTRNCDWWFTRDAVLIDTAGRYALQGSDREVDAAAWQRFLDLLRRTRPRRPINGVLLTVSVQDLLAPDAAERERYAAELRARLHELHTRLGVRPPVYALVTKADLIAGFDETFDAFGKEDRDQVWGVTFAADADGIPAAAAAASPLRDLDAQLDRLAGRLAGGLDARLAQERDPARRAAIVGFVQEFAAVRRALADFMARVFDSAGPLENATLLRGVYVTSGTQEGTPIERVLGRLSRAFGVPPRAAARETRRGKSFFLHRLLKEVVFREAHLVSFNPQAERRRRLLRAAGFAAVGLVALALLGAWTVSTQRNAAYADEVAARVPALQQTLDALPPPGDGDVTALLPALDAAERVAEPSAHPVGAPPLLSTLGLYQGDKLDAAAQQAWRKLLSQAFAPRIARRLEERLRASGRDNLEQTYEALKHYLMPYTPDRFDARSLKAWIALDWDAQLRNLGAAERSRLDHHLDALLALGAFDAAAVARQPMDRALVASARETLASFPLEHRVYSRLKRQQRADLAEFSVASSAGPAAARVFERTSREPLSRGVPGFHTRAGYASFQLGLPGAAAQLGSEEGWVLGRDGAMLATAKDLLVGGLADRVRRLYLADYVKAWDAFLADVRLAPLGGLDRSLEIARLLAAPDSPLAAFLRAAARETTLVPPAAPPGALDKAAAAADKAKGDLARLAGPQAAPAAAGGPPERMVDDHFAPLHRLVQGQPAPIDDVLKLFGEVYAQLQAVDAAQKTKSAPPPGAGGGGGGGGAADKVKAAAGQQPEPIRSMLTALADAGASQGRVAERDALAAELKPIHDFCQRVVANRYPFAATSKADTLPEDFGQLFGAGGLLDDFYQRRLAPLVDTGTTPWSYKPLADGKRPAAPAALADFQRAARIKEAFFRAGGKAPGFKLDVRTLDADEALKDLALDIDGQTVKLPAGGPPATVTWPGTRVTSQVRLLASPGAAAPPTFEGPWALFRLFDRFEVQPSGRPERFFVNVTLDGQKARLEVTANSVFNPFRMREIQQFRCPEAL